MNPRQRRGIVLLLLTAVCAVAVFLGVLTYVGDVSSQVGPMTTVVKLTQPVDALEPIEADMLETVEMPERWAPAGSLRDAEETTGLVAATAYAEGAVLQQGMLIPRPGVQPGFREVAIMVDAETGVAGKVHPGDHVDIIATIAGNEGTPPRSELWVSNALVLEVGLPQETEGQDATGAFTLSQGVPVTFALSTAESLRLAYGESFSVKLRLALRGAGDDQTLPRDEQVYTAPGGH
ncbi:Flp pilus assembly protein CpaB [Microbacterium sp. NPDC096154]|uniref:Flp pilus assembly protein CpaB n=1 Tax=Microbacterium sp. NPDC096154 TaxID=3155549 RepID=UPI003333E2AF